MYTFTVGARSTPNALAPCAAARSTCAAATRHEVVDGGTDGGEEVNAEVS